LTDRQETFFADIARLSDAVYRSDPRIPDRRREHPSVTGCLGDPFAPVWFIAEAPSLTQVERGRARSPEQQWDVSPGDKLFRRMLAKHGFKEGDALAPGGWRCYITDIIKSSYFVKDWNEEPGDVRMAVAEAWAPVLRYELEQGRPRLAIALGKKTQEPLEHLQRRGLIPRLPPTITIYHYSYLGSRPQGKLGPMHPDRLAAWDADFAHIAARGRELSR
jgi:uracil-DNA glycosylase